MSHEEYLAKRNEILDSAQEAINNGKLDEAKEIKAQVESLDAEFRKAEEAAAEVAEMKANKEALLENKAVPEVIKESSKTEEAKMEDRIYNASSIEYKNAWLKNMAVNAKGEFLIGAPTVDEQNAFTFTTANTGSVVPTTILNRIVELVQSMAPMYADATKSGLTTGFGIPRHKSIDNGDAAVTSEGVANDDEQDTFDLLSLDGVEIKKHVKITRKMSFQSIEAFEDWVVDHLAKRIAVAKETRILSQLSNTSYGIASDNVLTGQTYSDATIRSIFALIKETGAKVVYANGNTIWNELIGIKDGEERSLFIPSAMDDPLVQGRIYGALVKQDENIDDDVLYVGVPKSILANDFDALTTARDTDITTWITTISGYSLFDAALENPLAFVKASFS